jgi:Tol biopolymer transport system component
MESWICLRSFCVSVMIAFVVIPAYATFPGRNGRIGFIQGPDIFTMNPDGSHVRQLTTFTDDNSAFWENWSADGKQLVFSRFPAPDFFGQLWVMNADGSNQHPLLNDPGFDDEAPSFSPDGSHVIFSRCGPLDGEFPCAIYRVSVDGTCLESVTRVHIERSDFEPVYSPDGSTIAFDSFGRRGILGAIYLMDPDGSRVRELTPPVVGAFRSDWSPDGQTLAFSNHCCNPPLSSILTIRADRTKLRHLTHNGGTLVDDAASWSPEGDEIVFRRANPLDGSGGIFIVNVRSGLERMVHQIPATKFRMRSPRARRRGLRSGTAATLKQIEEDGFYPRWGVAQ